MIKCQICKQEFEKLISSTHLKKHNISSSQYKERYGNKSLASDLYRQQRSMQYSGKNNPNYGNKHTAEAKEKISNANKEKLKGIKKNFSEEHVENIRKAVKKREEKYQVGILARSAVHHSKETKWKISQSITKYARNNPEEMQRRAKQGYETKIRRYGKVVSSMKGKKHTEEAKRKMRLASIKSARKKKLRTNERIRGMVKDINCDIINEIDDQQSRFVELHCNNCHSLFSFTRQYFTKSKFHKKLCPGCYPRDILRSQGEKELYTFIKSIYPDAIHNDRSALSYLEIDIYLREIGIGFEYSGLYWHSEEMNKNVGRPKDFDRYKKSCATENRIELYTVFEDEWQNKREIVESRICNILNKTEGSTRIYARKCKVLEITSKEANVFLRKNHLQGAGRSNIRYGLYYSGKLISMMSFSKENISRKIKGWEINRFCSLLNHAVVGGASKLFKHFLREYNPKEVISYADSRWSNGNLYKTLGFEFTHNTVSNYWYFRPNEGIRIHRFSLRKNKDDDQSLTEYENRLKQGYLRIWDCGSSKWVWTP